MHGTLRNNIDAVLAAAVGGGGIYVALTSGDTWAAGPSAFLLAMGLLLYQERKYVASLEEQDESK